LALDALPPNSSVGILLEEVIAASEKAAALTRQMLAYSGRGRFEVSQIDLSTYVRESIPLIQAAVSRTVELQLDLAEDLPAIEVDTTQMQQIVMNLVINGAEAIPEGRCGKVTITTRRRDVDEHWIRVRTDTGTGELKPGSYVVLEVHDDGSGMDEATKARVFEPFFTTKFTGRGLGLAAVLGIVRGHRGSIQVSSTPGCGSVFRVMFPALDATPNRTPRQEEERPDLSGVGAILVIDDEETVRRAARQTLEHYGYSVLLAEDGARGLEMFRRNAYRIECVVLDMTMPIMSGEETLPGLRSLRADIPVILSSGFSEAEAAPRFHGKGLAGFIQKPYKAAALSEKVKDAIARAGRSAGSRVRRTAPPPPQSASDTNDRGNLL
jgi:CheY-like chemotaxis protein